jgi:lipoate-protein ligase A
MAIDAWLLQGLVEVAEAAAPAGFGPVFRLYRWPRPTLSLGWHQRRLEPHWRDLAAQGRIDLVRRPSGGRAVLHGGDLTYALVWPRPRGSRQEVYGRALQWLVHAFAAMGQSLHSGQQAASLQRSSCFATSTVADLVHAGGAKRVGSAQLWRGGHLLQHGSIQLDPCLHLWREVFRCDPPALDPLPLAGAALEDHLCRSALRWLPLIEAVDGNSDEDGDGDGGAEAVAGSPPRLEVHSARQSPVPLSAAELAGIAPSLGRYRAEWSGSGLTSPELTMPRAT